LEIPRGEVIVVENDEVGQHAPHGFNHPRLCGTRCKQW
jgi:hypothetical protein